MRALSGYSRVIYCKTLCGVGQVGEREVWEMSVCCVVVYINQMSGLSYLKCWTQYRKSSQLSSAQSVVGHKPNNRYQLTFDLQMAVHIALLSTLNLHNFNHTPATTALLDYIQQRNPTHILNTDYIRFLANAIRTHSHKNTTRPESRMWNVTINILTRVIPLPNLSTDQKSLDYLVLTNRILEAFQNSSKADSDPFKIIKEWWSFKQWKGLLSEGLMDLMIRWVRDKSMNHQVLDGNTQSSLLLVDWMNEVRLLLNDAERIDHQTVVGIISESKYIVKLSLQKGSKSSREVLIHLKQQLLSHPQKVESFAAQFGVLEAMAKQIDCTLFECQDLLENEYLYAYWYYLQRTDTLHHFNAFYSFMREHSVIGVLSITRTLSTQMSSPLSFDLSKALEQKSLAIMGKFNIKPITTAKQVLTHFLHLSGIFISDTIKKFKQRPTLKTLKLSLPDPLQFLLIKREYWQDKFGLQVLGLSAWIICEGYCKEVQSKAKDFSEKQISEYMKKLKIALCLFMLGLKYPTRMLQFVPFEADIAWDFARIPILPQVLVDSGYFFCSFHRGQLAFETKVDFGAEGDIFPWATTITNQKHIPFILHNHGGYQFFEIVLSTLGPTQFKSYAEAIVSALSTAFRNLGLSPEAPQAERRQRRTHFSSEARCQLIRVLERIVLGGDKLGETAAQLRGYLVDQ